MTNTPEAKKNSQPSSKPTLEQLVKSANEKKQVSKEELAIILERYKAEQKNINAKVKADIDSLSKEAGMDMIEKGISLKTKKDIQLLIEILSKNGIEAKIEEKTQTKILETKGVVAIYDKSDKQIMLYGSTGTRLGNINKEGGFDEVSFASFRGKNEPKDDDLGLIKEKNAIKEPVKKESIPSATEQEIKDAQFGLDVLDKYTKIELNEVYKKSGIDGIKKLAKLNGMMSQSDINFGLQQFGSKYDHSHILAAVKILKVFGEDKTKIEVYLNGGKVTNDKQTASALEWLNPDDIEKHRKIFLETLKKGKDINQLLTKENRPSYNFVFKNLNHKNTTGKLIFEEEGKMLGDKLKSYLGEKYKLDTKKLNIFIDPKQDPNIKVKLDGKDYGQITIKDEKFELKVITAKSEAKQEITKESSTYTIKKGDTLYKITKGNKKLIKKIKELNPEVKDWNKLSIGQAIKTPAESNISGKGEVKAEKKTVKQPKTSNNKSEKVGEKKGVEKKDNTKQEKKGKKEEKGVKGEKPQGDEPAQVMIPEMPKKFETPDVFRNKQRHVESFLDSTKPKSIDSSKPLSGDELNDIGNNYIKQNKYSEAIEAFDKAIEKSPNEAAYYFNKGFALGRLGNFNEAVSQYYKSVQLTQPGKDEQYYKTALKNMEDMQLCYGQGIGYIENSQYKEAIALFDKAIIIDAANPIFYYNKGIALERMGHNLDSQIQYKKALKLDPKNITYRSIIKDVK